MIGIVDYGVGNLFSLQSSLQQCGIVYRLVRTEKEFRACQGLILPGVGAFAAAMDSLRSRDLVGVLQMVAKQGMPLLGICLGMQVLLETGYEYGIHQGLGLIPGQIKPLQDLIAEPVKIPHMGWNQLQFPKSQPKHPLFQDVKAGAWVYFVHSYAATQTMDYTIASCDYSQSLTAAVARENVAGVQFHPEKSGETGFNILTNFAAWTEVLR